MSSGGGAAEEEEEEEEGEEKWWKRWRRVQQAWSKKVRGPKGASHARDQARGLVGQGQACKELEGAGELGLFFEAALSQGSEACGWTD